MKIDLRWLRSWPRGAWPQKFFVFVLIAGLVILLVAALVLVFVLIRAIFVRSPLLGLLFLFFVFPLVGRLIGFLFLAVFPLVLTLLAGRPAQKKDDKEADDVIDVKYKIVD